MRTALCVCLCLLSFGHFGCSSSPDRPRKEEDSDIFYYGFINNEKYAHYLPSKYPDTLRDRDFIRMVCKKGYTVSIQKAYIIDLNDEEFDFTPEAQKLCLKKADCKIDVKNFKRDTHLTSIDYSTELNVETLCMSEQKPLFDGNEFHEGVTDKYLVIRDRTLACVQKGNYSFSTHSIARALEVCSSGNCAQVVWNHQEQRAVICKDYSSDNLIEKKGSAIYMNPDGFQTAGHAVFLNYMTICDNQVKSVAHGLPLDKSVDICDNLQCGYFTKSYAGSIKSLKNTKNGKTWFCKGFPTMIPMDGFVTVVRKGLVH